MNVYIEATLPPQFWLKFGTVVVLKSFTHISESTCESEASISHQFCLICFKTGESKCDRDQGPDSRRKLTTIFNLSFL